MRAAVVVPSLLFFRILFSFLPRTKRIHAHLPLHKTAQNQWRIQEPQLLGVFKARAHC